MRAIAILQVLVLAAGPAYAGSLPLRAIERAELVAKRIDLDAASAFRVPDASEASRRDMLAHLSPAAPAAVDGIVVPSLSIGPFRAMHGGQAPSENYDFAPGSWGSHTRRGAGPHPALLIETESLWGSHIGGTVDSRGARLTFTWATP